MPGHRFSALLQFWGFSPLLLSDALWKNTSRTALKMLLPLLGIQESIVQWGKKTLSGLRYQQSFTGCLHRGTVATGSIGHPKNVFRYGILSETSLGDDFAQVRNEIQPFARLANTLRH